MTEKQTWVTYASNDHEGLKALVLGRSLRRSITRRQILVFIAVDVSENIWKLLQEEYDTCIRITKWECEKEFPNWHFSSVAIAQCWKLKRVRKFVYLDCNCLVLKNSDELFRNNGIGAEWDEDGKLSISLIARANVPTDDKSKLIENICSFDGEKQKQCKLISNSMDRNNKEDAFKDQLDEKYFTKMDLQSGYPMTGKEIKIVHFMKTHPLDLIFMQDDKIWEMSRFQQGLAKFCIDQLHLAELSPEISKNGTTFAEKVNRTTALLKNATNTSNAIVTSPDPKIMEDLNDSVAIIGMAFRFPGANTIDEFWDLLINGKDGIIRVPEGRWNKDQCFVRGDNIKDTQAGFLKCPIDLIDGKFFGLNAAELEYMDPQQRLCLQVVWEGLENAGISGVDLKETLTGVFGGWWRNDYKEILQESGLNETEFFRAYMGNALGTVTGRISHFLELTGPSISTESGCSTSIVAVDMACNSLKEESCDLALAFGVNLLLHPFSIDTMNEVISPDGYCKTFDAKADGFGRAEGCAVLVLKRFADAAKDGDRIWGVIRGSAVVQEGPSRSLGTPTVKCEALAMSMALERAGVQPSEVSFVETHGTGTPVGDPLEVAAVAKVYSEGRIDVLTIGSVKTNIGHTESVSGIAGIAKTILSLKNEIIPKHLHLESLNPEINLDVIPAQIPLNAIKWEKTEGKPRIAGVSSFGITGTDAHVILQETPEITSTSANHFTEALPLKMLTISAKSPEGLDAYLQLYKDYLQNTNEDLNDIEYSTHTARSHFPSRATLIGSNTEELLQQIEKKLFDVKHGQDDAPKICFLFTGQGSQYPGMAQELYDNSIVFKSHFDYCEDLLSSQYGFSLKHAIWNSDTHALSRTLYSQTSIFIIEYCLLKLWKSWGVKANCVVGHSLGEFAAAVAAEILTFKDALKLVVTRSKLIDALPNGKMIVVKESLANVKMLMKQVFYEGNNVWLDIAAVNTEEQTVLAGDSSSVQAFSDFCENNQIKTHILDSSHAFHSRHMNPILQEYKKTTERITYSSQTCEFVSGMEGKVMKRDKIDADYWVDHTREKVNFLKASKVVLETDNTIFLEIGPQPVLSAMILANSDLLYLTSPIECLPSIRRNEQEWKTIMNTLSKLYLNGVQINWQNYHRYSNTKKIDLPSHPFQPKSHWMELKSDDLIPIHPLVGSPLPNPSALKIFRSDVDVRKTVYLNDHVLGSKIIFPGAGFLEMCLVSGHSAVQCTETMYTSPNSAMTIENFQIEAPLCLNDDGKTQLQVIVSTEDTGETRTTIYSKLTLDKETHKWIKHASGIFSPFASKWEGHEDFYKDNLENIKARCSEKAPVTFSYARLNEIGMKFGPTFQTINEYWKGDNEAYFEVAVTQDSKRYILHPVMVDSMFQAVMICMNPDINKLHVPISITKYISVSKLTTDSCYVYCKTPSADSKEYTALLLDTTGHLVSVMVGAEFMETTFTNIMSLIDAQRVPYPNMYEEIFREKLGPFERRIAQNELKLVSEYETDLVRDVNSLTTYNQLNPQGEYFLEQTNRLNLLYMIKALYDLEVNLELGAILNYKNIVEKCSIKKDLVRFVRYILIELTNDNYLEILSEENDNLILKVIGAFPSKPDVLREINNITGVLKQMNAAEIQSVSATGIYLADILNGKKSALSILFPDDMKAAGPAEIYYKSSDMCQTTNQFGSHITHSLFNFIKEKRKSTKDIIRILEIGAGTGTFTEMVLTEILKDNPLQYEYTYTDISPSFFQHGERLFENSKMRVNYKVLNIEEDPMSQGFIPHHYDIIFAFFVIHSTKDIRESMGNIKNLLREDGFFRLVELTNPHRSTNLVFGALEGFWRFSDTDIRPNNCEMDAKKWKSVLEEMDFVNVSTADFYNSHGAVISGSVSKPKLKSPEFCTKYFPENRKSWIVFSSDEDTSTFYINKLQAIGKRVIVITPYETDAIHSPSVKFYSVNPENSTQLNNLLQTINNAENLEGVIFLWGLNYSKFKYEDVCEPFLFLCKFLVKRDDTKLLVFTQHGASISEDYARSSPLASPIIAMAKVLQNENQSLCVKCVDLDDFTTDYSLDEGFAELFTYDGEFNVAYRNHHRLVPRLVPWKIPNTALKFPKTVAQKLLLPPSHDISDLKFGSMELTSVDSNDIEVKVQAYGLNFRDIFAVMKPDPVFEKFNTVGLDYAGIVSTVGANVTKFKIGDRVFGINMNGGAMPSHLQISEDLVMGVPDSMTLWEAATIPVVAATAYVCLIEMAKIRAEDTVLIHTASGGVGMCAVQIAKAKGCNIIATAGSNRKREYLKNLGIQHVFHSRNTSYENDIKKAMNGKGVDVVLNSLTGEGFKEATLAVCNPNARFIEMSKLNVWSTEEVKALRPDVQYDIVDLSVALEDTMKQQVKNVTSEVQNRTIRPIPYVKFDAAEIRQALFYLQSAKHIGKVICVMPENVGSLTEDQTQTPLFNAESTYMITGGLGGIGLEVAKWMTNSGAKHILLVGRNPPKEKTAQEIQKILARDIDVRVMQCDVGNRQQCSTLLEEIKKCGLPTLRGIMHAAGVLSDGVIQNQTWADFETTFNPKVRGGWNLHELTLDYPLEHFVMFSSGSVNVGAWGQSNHVAANQFLDSLAQYRNGIGLPGISVNWGQWGQVGVVADMELFGLRPFTTLQGVSALEKIMRSHRTQTAVFEADLQILQRNLVTTKKYLEELKAHDSENQLTGTMDADQFWKEYDSKTTRPEKYEVVRKYVSDLIRYKMKMDVNETIEDKSNFQDAGMDSLMMIELKNALQMSVGKRVKISVNSVRDCKTVAELSNRLVDLISGEEELPRPSREELIELIKFDSQLPDDIKPEVPCSIKSSEIRAVLITGVSGNFGPYVLRELSGKPQIEKIYCVMRDNRLFSPKERLKQILSEKKLISEVKMEKVECVPGDVTKPMLGMSPEKYKVLSETVDAVFNLSVKSSMDEFYCKTENTNHSRTINVIGIQNVLRFACEKKTKHVFHASTSIATTKLDENGRFWESWPIEGEFDDQANCAYPISKFCCDRLVAGAVQRGIPCKAFRFPNMGGNVSLLDNHLMVRMMTYMHLGLMPARNIPVMIIPVSTCATLSLKVFFNNEAPFEMYNVTNPSVGDELALEDFAQEFGCKIEAVEQEEFFEKLNNMKGENAAEFKEMAKAARQEDLNNLEENPPEAYSAWIAGNKDIFLSRKLERFVEEYPSCLESSIDVLKKDLKYAKDNKLFSKFGL